MRYNIATGIKRTKSKASKIIMSAMALVFPGVLLLQIGSASAASQVIVTPPLNSQGWSTNDTAGAGTVSFNNDTSAPGTPHNGALQLTTTINPSDKAQYIHATNTAIADVTELNYYTKQNTPPGIVADPAYQLISFLNGGTSGFTTLVFEPYQNPTQGPIVNNMWQQWDVDAGLFWSTRTVTCSNGTIVGTPGGPATYTLSQINSICPNAVVAAFGVNIGSNNPGYDVEADLVNFNGTTYNFEPYQTPADKDACKHGGWQNVTRADGSSFKNQGDCIQYVNTGR